MFRLHDTTLEFVSLIKGVEETMPIIPYKEYRHQWMLDMAKAYRRDGSLTKGKDVPDKEKNLHTSRCPGIINIKNEGWIVRTHQDIKLTITMLLVGGGILIISMVRKSYTSEKKLRDNKFID